jgi:MFS family permease
MTATNMMTPPTAEPARVPMPVVWRFASSGLISAFAMLLAYPAAIVDLSTRGIPASQVGLFALLTPATMIAVILGLPLMQRALGRVALVRVAIAAGAGALAVLLTTQSFALWCFAAILIGVQFAIHWTAVDTVLSENVPKARAGAIIGFYQTLLAGAVAAGPGVVAILALPFHTAAVAGLVLMLVSVVPTFGVARQIDGGGAQARAGGLLRFWLRNPGLIAVAMLAGLFEAGTPAMGSVQALHLGFAAAAAVLVASVIATGSLLAQLPIGALADRFSVPRLMRVAGGVLLVSSLALPLAAYEPLLLWPLAAIWGAFGGGLQTLVYMNVAITRTGPEIALGMMTMALGFTFGSLVGPGLGGLALDWSPDHGLAVMLSALSALVLVIVVFDTRR